MQGYLNKGKEFLKLLINNGYEAFFVGEVVRNTIMNIEFKRIDIVTNASTKEMKDIFDSNGNLPYEESPDGKILMLLYNEDAFYFQSFNTVDNNLLIDSRSTLTKHYSKSLLDDLSTKNFTINAIAMSLNGKITDAFNGCGDIKTKTIRTTASPRQVFSNDPLNILNAIQLVSELKFKISDKTYNGMKKKAKALLNIDKELLAKNIKAILDGPYAKIALKQLAGAGIYKYIPSLDKGLKRLASHYHKINIEELLLMSFVLNGSEDYEYESVIDNVETFSKILNLAIANKKANYDKLTLFSNGLDVCLEANYVNYLLGKSFLKTKAIKKQYEELPIKKSCDLKYKGDEVLRITGINDTMFINEIMDDVCMNILDGTLENDFDAIQSFVLKSLTARGINFDLSRELALDDLNGQPSDNINPGFNSDEQNVNNELQETLDEDSFTNHRLKILEERLDEQDRLLKEKSEKLKEFERQKVLEVSSKMVNNSVNYIKQDSVLSSMIEDTEDFRECYREFIINYLQKGKENEED